jgi:hypothetical protein
MSRQHYPMVLIDEDAWQTICNEVTYWAERDRNIGGAPLESVFYPLTGVQLRHDALRSPFDPIELEDVKNFAVSKVFLPPREFTDYTSHSAQFNAHGQIEKMQQIFNNGISSINARYPQLLFLGPGHSHPFAVAETSPSRTDIEHHIRPYRRKNEELLGHRYSLALIIAQSPRNSRNPWQACAFAMDGNERVINLGIARVVNSSHWAMRMACARPYYRTRLGARWEFHQLSRLRDRLIEQARWPGGWTSFLIRGEAEKANLIMLPPQFPLHPPLQQEISLIDRQASKLMIANQGRAYRNYQFGGNDNGDYPGKF